MPPSARRRRRSSAVTRSRRPTATRPSTACSCSYTQNGALARCSTGLIDASRKGAYAVYSLPETAAGSLAQHRRSSTRSPLSDVEAAARLAQEHMLDVARRYATVPEHDADGAA